MAETHAISISGNNLCVNCGKPAAYFIRYEQNGRGHVQRTALVFACSDTAGCGLDGEIEYPLITGGGYLEIPRPGEIEILVIRFLTGNELSFDPLPCHAEA